MTVPAQYILIIFTMGSWCEYIKRFNSLYPTSLSLSSLLPPATISWFSVLVFNVKVLGEQVSHFYKGSTIAHPTSNARVPSLGILAHKLVLFVLA